ncbi:hypothetical protein EDC04DRAFT_2577695 [Pisolithus marmoratus]|nr:hypothetical protein EDC04DRAFT_2577695 [Pisolithus marmoratus]
MSNSTQIQTGPGQVSDRVYVITHSKETVTTAFASSPDSSPGRLMKKLYRDHRRHKLKDRGVHPTLEKHRGLCITAAVSADPLSLATEPTQPDLDRAAKCGNFGRRPSDLFLKIYVDILATIDMELWSGVVSPPLLGSRGVVTLSIISVYVSSGKSPGDQCRTPRCIARTYYLL